RGVRARARGGLGLRPPGGGGEFGWRPRRRARRRDRLPRPGGRPRRVRRRDLPATRRPRARAARWRGRAARGRDLLQLGPSRARSARHRIGSRGLTRTLLLAFNFPPLGGGIARLMGELALRYPPNSLIVSTGRHPGSAASDAQFPQPIDHAPIRATRLRTINGLVVWTARASALARRARPGFAWCGELKPAGYPARWLKARVGLPYGVVVYGTELLLLEAKIRRSPFKRWTARELLGRCAVAGVGTVRAHVEGLVADCGMGDAVRFLGVVPDDELPALYNAVDVYVGASCRYDLLAEGFGIAIVEASACGLPVVGGRAGGVPDAVRDGETGILVDPDDAAAVAHGITRLLDDAELRRRMGAAGRRAVETYYNWDRVARDLMEIDREFRRPDR